MLFCGLRRSVVGRRVRSVNRMDLVDGVRDITGDELA